MAHQQFANLLGNSRVLEHPEEFLGKNWKDVLNFWFSLDTITEEQWKSIRDAYYSLSDDEFQLACNAAWNAARAAVGYAACYAALSAGDAAWLASPVASYVADCATCELMGSHILKEQGKSLVFLPMFLNP